jgi:hypothetical protein
MQNLIYGKMVKGVVMLQQPKITKEAKDSILSEHGKKLLTKSDKRIKDLGEVFTPPTLIIEILEQLPSTVWDEGKTYLDPTAGDGNFLAAVLIIKMALGHTDALSTIYGVDLMQDNVDECRQRLIDIAGDTPANWAIVRHNIRCEDGLKYDYSFETTEEEQKFFDGKLEPTKKVKDITEDKPPETTFGDIFG